MASLFERVFPPMSPQSPQLVEIVDDFVLDLPSLIEGDYFRADCTVQWLGPAARKELDREKLRHTVLRYARPESARHSAAHLDTAQIAVNARLSRAVPPSDSEARHLTATVRLSADAAVQEAAADWERLRRDLEVRRLNDHLELDRLRHLRDDIFTKPDVARTYWLDKHPEALDAVLEERFDRVAEILESGPQPSTLAVANVIREFLAGLGPEHKEVMMGLLHKALADFGRADLALRLPPEPDGP
ncbi:hypothetical protein Q0Z83_109940 [Actinoplanes sichuanensis]|uniref:Uncharacterized protein n=1 Tax=Actinoplanes sichuanensis TaxID=512349 RepID=A0ABW4A248_9ACTN|nr:hypothetical protein [Actinoplanes sichuanensis]BEL12803.1 hypothetical protein Q0Z83_109940 [Actinoplanes sichuanensis]